MKHVTPSRRSTGWRGDGAVTRLQILEAAGELFGEMGIAHTTGKEIAKRAGSNSAAVNYYFGGVDALYTEVLVEAHRRVTNFGFLQQLSEERGDAAEKLEVFLQGMSRAILCVRSNWAPRVLIREMLEPSKALQTLLEREILPRTRVSTAFIAEIIGVPPDHQAVVRCSLSIMGPFLLFLVGLPTMLQHFDTQNARMDSVDDIVRHFLRFTAGGLAAIAADLDEASFDVKMLNA